MGIPEIFSGLLETRVLLTPCITLTKSRETLLFRHHREIAKRDNKLRRVCLSVSSTRTTRLPLGGFFYEIVRMSIFRKSVGKIQDALKSDKNDGYVT